MKKLLLINVLLVSQVHAQSVANSTPSMPKEVPPPPLTTQLNATQVQMKHAKSVASYAVMSFNAYTDQVYREPIDNWKLAKTVDNFQPLSSGFGYQIYEKSVNGKLLEVSIAFRGTDNRNPLDPTNDLKEWLGGPQYVDAVVVGKAIAERYRSSNIPITTTGHSLGGGLAQAAAFYIPNAKAVVFNTTPMDIAGVRQGVIDLLEDGRAAQLRGIFGVDDQFLQSLARAVGAILVPPYTPSRTEFTSETGEMLTSLARGGQGVQFNFTYGSPFRQHGVEYGLSAMVDGLTRLANPQPLSPPIYIPNINTNFNIRPSEKVNSFGEPSIVSSRFNGAYSVPFGASISVVRYDNLRFDQDGTTAKFTATNSQGQTSSAARNGASIVDQGSTRSNGINFNWGRWAENQDTRFISSTGASFSGVPVHYIYADFPTVGIAYPASGAFTFSMVGGTAPTDGAGQTGRLNNMQVRVDFGAQQFQVLTMGVAFANRNMNLSSTVLPFGQGANAREVDLKLTKFIAGNLTGTCAGAGCGTSTVGFINGRFAGPTANGLVAGYGVRNSGGAATTINIGGVVGLTR